MKPANANKPALQKKGSVVDNIRQMELQREERRKKFEEAKIMKADRAAANAAAGKNLDIEFDLMIQNAKSKAAPALNVRTSKNFAALCAFFSLSACLTTFLF